MRVGRTGQKLICRPLEIYRGSMTDHHLPTDLENLIIGHCPWGALNGCARACKSWAQMTSRIDLNKFVETADFSDIGASATICRLPNKLRHGDTVIISNKRRYIVRYALGIAVKWEIIEVGKTYGSITHGFIDSNVSIYAITINSIPCYDRPCVKLCFADHELSFRPIQRGFIIARFVAKDERCMETIEITADQYTGDFSDLVAVEKWAQNMLTNEDVQKRWPNLASAPVCRFSLAPNFVVSAFKKYVPEVFTPVASDGIQN